MNNTAASESGSRSDDGEVDHQNGKGVEKGKETKGKEKEKYGEDTTSKEMMDVFRGVVPIPMIVPGDVYGQSRPWFFSV